MNFLAAITILFPAFCQGASLSLDSFQEKMKKHVSSLPAKASASLRIELLGSGKVLYSHNADEKLNPASNTKLLTTIAALDKLGTGYSFETKVFRKGEDLIVMGNGDPYLVSERLYLLARDVARAGVKKVGSIRVNNSAYAETYRGLIEWDTSGEPFASVVSPTSLNFNSLEVHVVPGGEGNKPKVELGPLPHGYANLINNVKQVPGRSKSLVLRPVRMEGVKESFEISGTIGRSASPGIVYASVSQPESYLSHVFASLLRQEGVEVAKDFGGVSQESLSGSEPLARLEGVPLLDLVRLFNTFSNNFMTEQVFHAFGAAQNGGAASLEKSRKAMAEFLNRWEPCRGAEVDNGSGLSWSTRISARCFSEALQWTYRDFRVFADLLGSLPAGGQTGTLKSRFRKLGKGFDPMKVRAKTGTLWSKQAVTSLVGFTRTSSGEPVVFVLIENDQRPGTGPLLALKDWEDKCVEYIQQLQL